MADLIRDAQGNISPAAAQLSALQGRVKHVYYPTAVLRLTVRLDDFSNEDGGTAQSEAEPAPNARAESQVTSEEARQGAAEARALGDFDLEDQATARKVQADAAAPSTGADAAPPNDVPKDDLSFEISVVPLELSVELNSFRIADKMQATFSLRDLPLHPNILRACLVEAYIGTARAEDFADPSRWIPSLLGTMTPMFRGYVDEESMDVSESDLTVQFEARSLEARLMDEKIHPLTKERRIRRTDSFKDGNGHVVSGEKITSFLKRLMSTIPEFSGALGDSIGVRIFPNFDPAQEPILSSSLFLRSIQTAQSRAQAGGQVQAAPPETGDQPPAVDPSVGTPVMPAPPGEMSVWDVITRACELVGLLPTYDPSIRMTDADGTLVRGADNILLLSPQNLKETPSDGITIPGGPIDGFTRTISLAGAGSAVRTQVRFMVWGHNISKMKLARKFGRVKAPMVRVTCSDPDQKAGGRVLVAQFPKTPRGTNVAASGTGRGKAGKGHKPTMEVVTKVLFGIRDQAQLEQAAVAIYHSISRHEVTCEIETDEMSSYIDPTRPETHNENPDLLSLRPGTPCRVMVARRVVDPAVGTVGVDELSQLFDTRANPAFLRKALIGGSAGAALSATGKQRLEAALAKIENAYQSARLTDWFYTRVVHHKFSASDGYSVSMELANFIEARNLPSNLSPQDKAQNDKRKKAKRGTSPINGRDQAVQDGGRRVIDQTVRDQ